MEVELNRKYPLAVSADRAWAVLTDIRAVGGCMPGAQITDQVDATHYKGVVRSKVGPAVMSFTGDIEVLGLDVAARTLELLGKGSEKGGSSAAMKLVARLEAGADAGSCTLFGDATVTISGKLAQFGGRLLVPIADAMLAQFAKNFEAAAVAVDASTVPEPMPAPMVPSPTFDATATVPIASLEPVPLVAVANERVSINEPVSSLAPAVVLPMPRSALPVAPAPMRAPANELNALSLAWIVLRGWFLGLFGKKTT